ncbi:MAG: VCBS repeat-containing protein [Myxococcota bacterium]
MGVPGSAIRWGSAVAAAFTVTACVQNNPDFTGDTGGVQGSDSGARDSSGTSTPGDSSTDSGGGTAGGGEGTGAAACPDATICLEEVPLLSGYDAFDVAVADFDQDTLLDVLLGYEGGALVVFSAEDETVSQVRSLGFGFIARRVVAADLDRDAWTRCTPTFRTIPWSRSSACPTATSAPRRPTQPRRIRSESRCWT